ncbi:MAG TPA: C4-dicarboxylic acid transporter DauA [Gammaproteobacteria bacterium]|nr:C4-dicarboxylic acid transporter DauA [Gammaproteobacteria bacterium]HQZ87536.1 C4-dicarboxylic acid transporter DauA [Gammaproteobacteria bacterium]HRA42491.1 C4-dicarboxylic acid transporter DauA [Gammaproteobacteria bacterium]
MKLGFFNIPLAKAIRETWRQGYRFSDFFADLGAGLTLCIIAIPMTMAVAIACGVQPEHGLYGAIIAGPLIGLLGGSRLSVSGPVVELAVLIYPVVYQFGFGGLMLVTWMAGLILLIMGLAKLGRVIEFIPYPVTTGFIAGTGVVICALQIKDFFGLDLLVQPKYFVDRLLGLAHAFPTWKVGDTAIGIITLMVMMFWSRLKLRIPAHLIAIIVGSLAGMLLPLISPDLSIETIGSRYGGIPQTLPQILSFKGTFDLEAIRILFGSAFAIAMLCSIKALLCAVVLDGMTGTKHNPNSELIAHGIGNLVLPFFGGITSTSALSRSVANLRVGARSPLAAVIHGISILFVILIFAPILSYLPMAALAALLLMAAWNIFDFQHCLQIVRVGTRSDVAVLLICFGLTVLLDMVIAVGVGMVLAALLFMKQMANITGGRWLLEASHWNMNKRLPDHVMVYEISGPLFFGAAEKAMSTLREHSSGLKVLILQMHGVPTMDISGVVALKSALESLQKKRIFVILSEVQTQPMEALKRAGLEPHPERLAICENMHSSVELAKKIM